MGRKGWIAKSVGLAVALMGFAASADAFTVTTPMMAAGTGQDFRCCVVNAGRRPADLSVRIKAPGSGGPYTSSSGPTGPGSGRCTFWSGVAQIPGQPVYCEVEGSGSSRSARTALCTIRESDWASVTCLEGR